MSYFTKFPSIEYPYEGFLVDGLPKNISCSDLSVRYRIIPELFSRKFVFYDYTWRDHDRPDIVAKKYYGTTDLTWVVLLSMQVFNVMSDLPLSDDDLIARLVEQTGLQFEQLSTTIHHYEDDLGQYIDYDTYMSLPDTDRKAVTIMEWATLDNDRKRTVKLLSRDLIDQLLLDFEKQIEKLDG